MEQLRRAILKSKLPQRRIAEEAGVDEAIVSGFVHGKRGMRIDTFERLCKVLDLQLVEKKRR